MSDRSSTPILSPGAKCVEIGLLPDLAERVGRRARHMLVHPWRKPRPGRPARERPCRADRPDERRIAGLSPGGVLHVGHVPELVDGHHSPSRSSRRRSRSASARSRGLTVSTRLILPPEVSAIAHFDRPTAAAPQRISAGGSRALVRATRRTGPRRAGRRASRRHWPPPPIPFLPARRVVNRGHHGRQRTSRAFTVGRTPFRSQFAAVFLTLSAMRTGSPRTRRASSSSRSGTAGPVRHTPPVPNAGRSHGCRAPARACCLAGPVGPRCKKCDRAGRRGVQYLLSGLARGDGPNLRVCRAGVLPVWWPPASDCAHRGGGGRRPDPSASGSTDGGALAAAGVSRRLTQPIR